MTKEQLRDHILKVYPDAEVDEEARQYLTVIVPSEHLHKVTKELREGDDTQFDFLFCLSGVDYPEYLMVVYHLKSTEFGHSLVLKAKIENRENSHIESVYDLWKTAEFHEREAYDLFGIIFDNHPDLRRIFLDDDWVGYPLRKDYEDEINIVEL